MNQQTPDNERLDGSVMTHEKSGRIYQVVIEGTGTEDNTDYVVYIPAKWWMIPFIKLFSFLILYSSAHVWVRTRDDFTGLNSRGMQRFIPKK